MKTQLIIATLALTFSLGVYAEGTEHAHEAMDHSNMTPAQMKEMNMQGMDHAKMDHSKMNPQQMNAMHKAMEAEMIKIINTVDINARKKLFVAHQAKNKSMKEMMMKQCSAKK